MYLQRTNNCTAEDHPVKDEYNNMFTSFLSPTHSCGSYFDKYFDAITSPTTGTGSYHSYKSSTDSTQSSLSSISSVSSSSQQQREQATTSHPSRRYPTHQQQHTRPYAYQSSTRRKAVARPATSSSNLKRSAIYAGVSTGHDDISMPILQWLLDAEQPTRPMPPTSNFDMPASSGSSMVRKLALLHPTFYSIHRTCPCV